MRKYILVLLVGCTVPAFLAMSSARANWMHKGKAAVTLTAFPQAKTSATGEATFALGKDGKTIHYKLHVKDLEDATMAHVHAVGENGTPAAIIVWLYPATGEAPSTKKGDFSGALAEGDITPDKLSGAWKGKPVKELFEQIESGKAGVAVHTVKNPGVELWGVHKEKMHREEMPMKEKGY